MRVVMVHEFVDHTGLDRDADNFDDTFWEFVSSKRELSDWWAENQGKYV
jgi:hypothetical protein